MFEPHSSFEFIRGTQLDEASLHKLSVVNINRPNDGAGACQLERMPSRAHGTSRMRASPPNFCSISRNKIDCVTRCSSMPPSCDDLRAAARLVDGVSGFKWFAHCCPIILHGTTTTSGVNLVQAMVSVLFCDKAHEGTP